MHKKVVCAHTYFVWCAAKGKIRIKFGNFQVPISQKLRGRFLSNLVCKVVYMVGLKYVNLIEIDPIVFKLQ